MNYVFLTRFSYTLFTKTLLLFHISLLKRFIYRNVYTSKIFSMVQQFLPHLTRIRSRQCLFISLRKSYLPLKLSTASPQEKSCLPKWFRIFHMLVKKTLLPVAYVTELTFIDLQNIWLLLFGNISSELSYINNCFQIPIFLIDKHCSRKIL